MLERLKSIFGITKNHKTVVLQGNAPIRGSVAISYLTWPFQEDPLSPRGRGHTNAHEVLAMAQSFVDLGFCVEISDWNDATYTPPPNCRIAIDLHSNLERWSDTLHHSCKKVLHATGCYWKALNIAEINRIEDIRRRKGVVLKPRRQVAPTRAPEHADEITVLGNSFTSATFEFLGKPITRIPISSVYRFPFPEERNHETARRRFLWLGSHGMVHKGLDLVLEAFAGMPELELTVCGRPEKEDDFFRLYEKELKGTPNIHLHGWIDMASYEFREIAKTHAAIVYPSCSEGGAGSVIHCMHAGMVPICTREASVDLMDFGILIKEGSIQAVQEACREFASITPFEMESSARKSHDHVNRIHTREQFTKQYNDFALSILQ
jgi:glycosyltransferase involved in cell wall biosynthesis